MLVVANGPIQLVIDAEAELVGISDATATVGCSVGVGDANAEACTYCDALGDVVGFGWDCDCGVTVRVGDSSGTSLVRLISGRPCSVRSSSCRLRPIMPTGRNSAVLPVSAAQSTMLLFSE